MKNFITIFTLLFVTTLFTSCNYFNQNVEIQENFLQIDLCNFTNHPDVVQHNTTFIQDTAYTEPYTVSGSLLTFKAGLSNPVVSTNPQYPHVSYEYKLFYLKEIGNGIFEQTYLEKFHNRYTTVFDLRNIQLCAYLQINVKFCNAQGQCIQGPISTLMKINHPHYCC